MTTFKEPVIKAVAAIPKAVFQLGVETPLQTMVKYGYRRAEEAKKIDEIHAAAKGMLNDTEWPFKLFLNVNKWLAAGINPVLQELFAGKGYDAANTLMNDLVIPVAYKLPRNIDLQAEMFFKFLTKGLRSNPAQEISTIEGHRINLAEIFVSRDQLTDKGAEIIAAILKGDLGPYKAWFDACWLASDKSAKETPKPGVNVPYDAWFRKIYDLVIELAQPFESELKWNDSYEYEPLDGGDNAISQAFGTTPVAHPLHIELERGRIALDFPFDELAAHQVGFRALIGDPRAGTFNEHIVVVYDQWFKAVVRNSGIRVPVSNSSPGARNLALAWGEGYRWFAELIDPNPPADLRAFEERVSPGATTVRELAVHDIGKPFAPFRSRKDWDPADIHDVYLPLMLDSNSYFGRHSPPGTLQLNFDTMHANMNTMVADMGFDTVNNAYAFKQSSRQVFMKWYHEQWAALDPTHPDSAIPLPGSLNYDSYMVGFDQCYEIFKLMVTKMVKEAEIIFVNEEKVLRGLKVEGTNKVIKVIGGRVLGADDNKLLQEWQAVADPKATPPPPEKVLDIPVTRGNYRWAPPAQFSISWKVYVDAYEKKLQDIDRIRGLLRTRAAPELAKAEKVLDDMTALLKKSIKSSVTVGLEEHIAAQPAAVALQAEMKKLMNESASMNDRVVAFDYIVLNGNLPADTRRRFRLALDMELVVAAWRDRRVSRIRTDLAMVNAANIAGHPQAFDLQNRVVHTQQIDNNLRVLRRRILAIDPANLNQARRDITAPTQDAQDGIRDLSAAPAIATPVNTAAITAGVTTGESQVRQIAEWIDVPNPNLWNDLHTLENFSRVAAAAVNLATPAAQNRRLQALQLNARAKLLREIEARIVRSRYPLPIPFVHGTPVLQGIVSRTTNLAVYRSSASEIVTLSVADTDITDVQAFILANMHDPIVLACGHTDMQHTNPALVAAMYIERNHLPPALHARFLAATILAME